MCRISIGMWSVTFTEGMADFGTDRENGLLLGVGSVRIDDLKISLILCDECKLWRLL